MCITNYNPAPWQFLNFLPLPQGHISFLPTVTSLRIGCCGAASRVSSIVIGSLPTEISKSGFDIFNLLGAGQMGYRVQIFYGSDRRQVFSEQARFKSAYQNLNTYITYKEPNYYLRVGDFRTRLEAQRLLNELRPMFPTLFIFREKINAPNLDYSNDNER